MLKQISQSLKHRKTLLPMLLLIATFAVVPTGLALADSGNSVANAVTQQLTNAALVLVAFILAGIAYSLTGYVNNIRNHDNYVKAHPNGPADLDWKGFEPAKMRDDVLVGLILGVGGFLASIAAGDMLNLPQISNVATFIGAYIFAYGAIVKSDKIIVGALLNH